MKTKWYVEGKRKGEDVCLNCEAEEKEDAKFIFSHSPSALGVKINWKSLREEGHCSHGKRFDEPCHPCYCKIAKNPAYPSRVRRA